MTKYITNFCRDAIDHWENYEAVREYLQNWLDSEGEREFSIGEDYIELTNKGIQVSSKSLMTGKSDKKNDSSKRGNFGTGSIFSMCVLTARGVDVQITNNNVTWIPAFEHCSKFEEDVLVINEEPCNTTGNFTVMITGLSEDDINDIRQTNLVFQERAVIASTRYGDIIESVDDQGEVFCGQIFVQQTNGFKYSYDIKPEYLTLDQDRRAVSEWSLQDITAKLIMDTDDEDLIADAIEANMLDTTKVQYSWVASVPDKVSESFGEDFVTEHKGKFVTSDYSDHQENEQLGNPSVYIDNPTKVRAIQQSTAYEESIADLEILEKQTIDEFVEVITENIMYLVNSNMNAESGAEVKKLLDHLTEEASNWSGGVDHSLAF